MLSGFAGKENNMKTSGNTILITGGGTGIGKELAIQLKALDNEVIICGRRESRLVEVSELCPGINYMTCDITSDADRRDLFANVTKNFPEINVLINNGAFQVDRNLALGEAELDGLEEEVASIFTGPIRLNGLFIPYFAGKTDPVIINVTSILGFTPIPPIPVYCSAKAGFHLYTIMLRKHLEQTPIKVIEVIPPAVKSELNQEGRKKRTKPGAVYPGLETDFYVGYVIKELEKGNLDIFCDESNELKGHEVMDGKRYEVEQKNLR